MNRTNKINKIRNAFEKNCFSLGTFDMFDELYKQFKCPYQVTTKNV